MKIITKCDHCLLQNASGFLLQNATVLIQNLTAITKCDDLIQNCYCYYKMRGLLKKQISTRPMIYFILIF